MTQQSRRSFIKRLGGLTAGAAIMGPRTWRRCLLAAETPATRPASTTQPAAATAASIVVDLANPLVLSGARIHESALQGMILHGLRLALDQPDLDQPWRRLLREDDVVGIKFDSVGYEDLATTDVFATALVHSLSDAGIPPQRIVLMDVPKTLSDALGTRPASVGWQSEEVAIGQSRERLARALEDVTAIVNVPMLKNDNVTGLAGAIKNASLPFVRRQLPYYRNAGTPHLAQIAALPQIRSKLRVHIVNGLRAVFDGGPAAPRGGTWLAGRVLVSTDPVAIDQVCVDILDERRQSAQLPPIGDRQGKVAHVHAAAQLGLGTDDQDYIRLLRLQES